MKPKQSTGSKTKLKKLKTGSSNIQDNTIDIKYIKQRF